ncbi:hypothetical protein D9V32_03265 [Mycetocola tolaasinivorans]|uniref:Uncharacterized protein n=1 Tax=Mycetocola tolaasinivorans TaxID=76635 RepID=A0A3L7ACE7_9MICO|nr:DUF6412 domain-containing protein [Mycetocola tolaasinivorans]RLP77480.1 hypothetical protein D9V32_03265 [Mycetocola tolaasinivorans]
MTLLSFLAQFFTAIAEHVVHAQSFTMLATTGVASLLLFTFAVVAARALPSIGFMVDTATRTRVRDPRNVRRLPSQSNPNTSGKPRPRAPGGILGFPAVASNARFSVPA